MIDAKKILKKLRGESNRGKTDMYLDKALVARYRALCRKQKVSPNKTLEELMSQYIEQTKRIK